MMIRPVYTSLVQGILRALVEQVRGFDPISLFGAGEQGVWYDPSNMSTLSQDAAGTVPVTAAGQPVGRMLDISGRGNHATQATAASRPLLARHPLTGARNLLTFTEEFNDAAWSRTGSTIVADTDVAPSGEQTMDKLVEDTSTGVHSTQRGRAFTSGVSYVISCHVKPAGRTRFRLGAGNPAIIPFDATFDVSTGQVVVVVAGAASIVHVGNGVYRCSIIATAASTGSTNINLQMVSAGATTNYTGDGTSGVLLWGAQVEVGSALTAYQKVVTSDDITQAGVPDAWYLKFDGTDDFLVTAAIDFTVTDKMSVFAGIRKLSDAAIGAVLGLGTSPANVGSFELTAPYVAAAPGIRLGGRSTTGSAALSGISNNTDFASPVSIVVAGTTDYASAAGSEFSMRLNTAVAPTYISPTEENTGTFGNQQFFIGRRAGTTLPFTGHLYGLIVRGALSTAEDINITERYLANKSGVTLP